jgi:hypothetical protein
MAAAIIVKLGRLYRSGMLSANDSTVLMPGISPQDVDALDEFAIRHGLKPNPDLLRSGPGVVDYDKHKIRNIVFTGATCESRKKFREAITSEATSALDALEARDRRLETVFSRLPEDEAAALVEKITGLMSHSTICPPSGRSADVHITVAEPQKNPLLVALKQYSGHINGKRVREHFTMYPDAQCTNFSNMEVLNGGGNKIILRHPDPVINTILLARYQAQPVSVHSI